MQYDRNSFYDSIIDSYGLITPALASLYKKAKQLSLEIETAKGLRLIIKCWLLERITNSIDKYEKAAKQYAAAYAEHNLALYERSLRSKE